LASRERERPEIVLTSNGTRMTRIKGRMQTDQRGVDFKDRFPLILSILSSILFIRVPLPAFENFGRSRCRLITYRRDT
jgi:hypothetical protein